MPENLGVSTQPVVYLGIWTNWSKGKVLGLTLTMDQRNGSVLIACIAIFITFAGSGLWRIACFAFHHAFSSSNSQDALYHQRQAILKNSDDAFSGMIKWIRLLMAWRKHGQRPFQRLVPLTFFTAVIVACFTAAGILSSNFASMTGQEVLLQGASCGVNILGRRIAGQSIPSIISVGPFFTTVIPFLALRLVSFSNYALKCYSTNPNPRDCSMFVQKRLPFEVINRNASCPFRKDLCRLDKGNLFIDTGYMNSHYDLGINSPPNERFLYRRTTHCAPLVTEGFRSYSNFSRSGFSKTYMQLSYGRQTAVHAEGNLTYIYPQKSFEEYDFQQNRSRPASEDYTLR